ncbi:tRNA modification radical SAM protein MnmL/YtqA [Desulfoplanes sp.]
MRPPSRYFSLSTYFHNRHGHRVQKIPLDAGFSCPNRDGTLSAAGCLFCNPLGSGTGQGQDSTPLAEQYNFWRARFHKKYKAHAFLGYLQSFTNTYGPLSAVTRVLDELRGLPELAGVCIGTRPDCLDRAKLAALAKFPGPENWLDLGLQSANDQTLVRINRGHDVACFERSARMAGEMGLKVCAHVIAGLPGETKEDFLATIDFLNRLPVQGIKIHNLYVCKGAGLALWWRRGDYLPPSMAEYVGWVVHGLAHLRPDIVIHRLNGDPQPGELLAPDWAGDKSGVLQAISLALAEQDTWQGRAYGRTSRRPPWFDRDGGLPADTA